MLRPQEQGEKAVIHSPWWWISMVGILLLVGAAGGCDGGGHDDDLPDGGGCLVFGEVEPNATPVTAQLLADLFVDECVIVNGSLFDVADVDSYRVLIQESFTLVVTLDHSPLPGLRYATL